MHTSQYYDPDTQTGWAVHYNGDPLPGPVLINRRNVPEYQRFRTTSEEIAVFLTALRLDAMPPILTLKTTIFAISDNLVQLRAVIREEADDALELQVPLSCLESYATDLMLLKYERSIEALERNEVLAGIGIVSFFLNTQKRYKEQERGGVPYLGSTLGNPS